MVDGPSRSSARSVTTTVNVLGDVWPADVLVADLDPAGGDLALRHRDLSGEPLDPERGLLSLAAAARRGVAQSELEYHVQRIDGGLDIVAGVARPEQVTGIGPVWPALAHSLRGSGVDVLADCGRITPGTPVMPVMAAADAVVFVVRPSVESYAHLRERLHWLSDPLQIGKLGSIPVGVVVVTSPSDTSAARDLDRLLQYAGLQVSVLGRIAEDPKAVRALTGQASKRLGRTLLVRSARQVATSVRSMASGRSAAPAGR
jgi:MinD-like ATPase involved in chromosome partitioning or flagellar assembly